ncbi:MAG: type III-A CRISPR-associated RAMP protein Csm5 [Chloroflexota bacterium]
MDKYNYKTYRLKVVVLSPLHIGNGREMLHEYDYAIYGGRTWRFNENALLETQNVEDPKVLEILTRTKPAQLLKKEDYIEKSPLFRYVLKGTPKSSAEGAVVREQIKDAFDRPYLPGTTLKGSLRTALAGFLWERKNMRPQISELGGSPKFAASNYERKMFGKNPNFDLMRAMHIADSLSLSIDNLMLVNVRVLTGGGKPGSPIEAEAIRRDTEIISHLKLDTVLFSKWAQERELYLPNSDALLNFIQIARHHSITAIQRELAWARRLPDGKNIVSYYETLLKHTLQPNEFFLQLGWGGGWEEKTLGEFLKRDENFMRTILKPRKQNGYDVGRGHIPKNPKDFPVSRRIAMAYQRDEAGNITKEIPALPLGWVLVTVESDDGSPVTSTADQKPKIVIPLSPSPETKPAAAPKLEAKPTPLPGKKVNAVPKPPVEQLIEKFSSVPKLGDRFSGTVFSDDKGEIWLSIPGLDADNQAYAVILRSENPLIGKVKDGDTLDCQVVELSEESSGYWRVKCKLG